MSPAPDDGGDRDERARRAPADPGQRNGGRARPDAVPPGGRPGSVPAGRWPADFDPPLARSQQLTVNEAVARLPDAPGVLTVPGPPAAGQVTLLRELAAAVIVARAERLAGLASPADAFGPPTSACGPPTTTDFGPPASACGPPATTDFGSTGGDRRPCGRGRPAVTPLNQALAGLEIVVAAADSGAAGNIAAEVTGPQSIGARWREAAAGLDYFGATARLAHGDGAWAMIAVRLGDAADHRAFADKFRLEAPGRAGGCPGDLPGEPAGPPVGWDAAREGFLAAREKVNVAAERAEVTAAAARLTDLRREAATAYAAITATEDALRSLAGQRVTAERSLRAAWHHCQAAVRALDAHARAKPGLPASRPAWLGGGRDWRARQGELGAALRDSEATVSTAQRAVAEARAGFAAAVQARAEPAAVLRRLTAECAAAQEVIARGRQRPDGDLPDGPGFPGALSDAAAGDRGAPGAPWADPELAAARTEAFLAALALHKALICAEASRVRENLAALADFLSGDSGPGDPALLAAWQTLFLVVPVVCTTFASVPALFGGLGPEPVGLLVIDETGQAPPQQVADAIGRARRTVTVTEGPPPAIETAGRDRDVADPP